MKLEYPAGATPLDPDELAGLRHKHVQTRAELDQLEQANIQQGLLWLNRQQRCNVLDTRFCLTLHKQLFGAVWKWAGRQRTTEKNIGVDPLHIAVDLKNLIDDVEAWIEFETYPPKEIALRFHHRLVKIHPFPNGNGRHARIMADALLKQRFSSPGIDWAGGSLERIGEQRELYIQALREADAGNIQLLLSSFDLLNR
jgi:Fic-DOC domain mobile mystery protein B